MDVLNATSAGIRERKKLRGLKIGMALHVEAKTACLALSLRDAGAEVRLASCNPMSTDDSVSLALREEYGLETFARKGETNDEYYYNLNSVLDLRPEIVVDDGADLIAIIHTSRRAPISFLPVQDLPCPMTVKIALSAIAFMSCPSRYLIITERVESTDTLLSPERGDCKQSARMIFNGTCPLNIVSYNPYKCRLSGCDAASALRFIEDEGRLRIISLPFTVKRFPVRGSA